MVDVRCSVFTSGSIARFSKMMGVPIESASSVAASGFVCMPPLWRGTRDRGGHEKTKLTPQQCCLQRPRHRPLPEPVIEERQYQVVAGATDRHALVHPYGRAFPRRVF